MSNDVFTIREHSTDPIDFQLLADDDAIDLTDVNHVEMEMKDKRGNRYSYSTLDSAPGPYISITTASDGKVKFSPPTELIFLATGSPYKGYWKVYTTATVHYSVPEDREFRILVREEV